jgi:hypothetical protein
VPRVAPWLLASLAVAGCGGSVAERSEPPARIAAAGRVVAGEVRSPDARTRLLRASGLWRCPTHGRVELRISPEGLASLSLGGGLLAQVYGNRALINRTCASQLPERLPPFRAPRGVAGESLLSCSVPRRVLVDLRHGDLTVRETGGRFLLGAAVSPDHLVAAGYWRASCSVDRTSG